MDEGSKNGIDIFHWANQTDAHKNDLQVELFVFNKHYTPFHMRVSDELESQIRPLFLFDAINTVNLGAGTGMSIKSYESSEPADDVLLHTSLDNVGRAETLIHLIENERKDIQEFSEGEHEFKTLKGIIARFIVPGENRQVFYAAKMIQQSNAIKGALSWELVNDTLRPFKADVGFRVPADNQVVIIEQDIFIFNQVKFERLFQYDVREQQIASDKVKQIEATYQLSLADGLALVDLVKDKKSMVNKLEKLEIGEMSQQQVLDYADEVGIDLMTDDSGAIIILDSEDVKKFVNLINEDYVVSEITGNRYEIKTKKQLDVAMGSEPPRG